MIHPQSTSYPYLAVAQLYGVPYGDVLRLSDLFDNITAQDGMAIAQAGTWEEGVLEAWSREWLRRKGV